MPRRVETLLLLAILAAALALRVYDLRGAPPGAQHDEVFSANFATQILDGARPVYWDQNGGVPVLHAYLVAPVFALFGSNILTLRLVSVICGLAVIVFTYLCARRLFGGGAALLASALLSVTQWHLFESRVGLEPVTLMMLGSMTAWAFVRFYVSPPPVSETGGRATGGTPLAVDLATGLLLGVAQYSYQPAPLMLVALAGFAIYRLIWQRALFQQQWRAFARIFAVALLLMAPLLVHFLTTEGDASSRLEDLSADLRGAAAGDIGPLANDAAGVAGMLALSGDPSFRYNLPGRPVFTLLGGLLAYGGLWLALRRWRDPRYAFVVLWIVCDVIASAVTRASPSYLRSSAALPLIVMLPGIAIGELRAAMSKFSAGRTAQIAVPALVAVLLAWESASTFHDYFAAWANLDRVRTTYRADLAEIAAFLDAQQPAGTVMLSARYPSDLDQGALYLLQEQQRRYQWFNGRRVFVLPNDHSGQGVSYFIPATNQSLSDGAALLQTLDTHPGPLNDQGQPSFTLYTLPDGALAGLRARAPQIPIHANAGGEVELAGADANPGNHTLHLLLYWRVLLRVTGDKDRSFFTHLVDAGDKLWTQEDRSAYPTSSWQDDDIVWQWYDLQLPSSAPPGDYWVELGVYDANAPGQPRVPILGADGKPAGDHVRIGPFAIR